MKLSFFSVFYLDGCTSNLVILRGFLFVSHQLCHLILEASLTYLFVRALNDAFCFGIYAKSVFDKYDDESKVGMVTRYR